MAGLSLNKDNLSYDSILRLQQLLAEGMKLHDPAQAESMSEMLKKMRVSPEQKPSFQFTSPKPPAQAAPDTARGRPVNGATWSPSPLMPTRKKRSKGSCLGGFSTRSTGSFSLGTPPSEPSAKDKRHKRVSARPSKSKTAKPFPRRPSTSARLPNREPLSHFGF